MLNNVGVLAMYRDGKINSVGRVCFICACDENESERCKINEDLRWYSLPHTCTRSNDFCVWVN